MREPYFNVPTATGITTLILCIIFGITTYIPRVLDEATALLAFIPALFVHNPATHAYRLLTHGVMHYGLAHILLNVTGLLAFGSGLERIAGAKHMLTVFLGGIIIGALGHCALYYNQMIPLGGASAGVSALFGAVIPFIMPRDQWRRVAVIFVLFNAAVGMLGVPDEPGLNIAWQAHIAGFIFGFIYGRLLLRENEADDAQTDAP